MWQDFLPFLGWIIVHCMYMPHSVYAFVGGWTFGCFYVLVILNSVAMSIGMQISLWDLAFNYLDIYIYPQVGLLDQVVVLFLIFGGNSILFALGIAPFYNPTNSAQFLHVLADTCSVLFSFFSLFFSFLFFPFLFFSLFFSFLFSFLFFLSSS